MNKNEKRASETKEKLCTAFIELYSESDIQDITIKSITDRAGYNRGTFYLYYKDIYDILDHVKDSLFAKAAKKFAAPFSDFSSASSQSIVKILLEFYEENQNAFILFARKDITFRETLKKNIKAIFEVNTIELEYIVEYHLSAVINFLNYWCSRGNDLPVKELLSLLFNISRTEPLSMLEKNGFFDKPITGK